MPTPGTLRITNTLPVSITVTSTSGYCQDAPADGTSLVIAAGAQQDLDFCRRGGHNCDGNQGSFTLLLTETQSGFEFGQQGFNFDAGGYINTNPPSYRVALKQIGSSNAYELDILEDAWMGSNWGALSPKTLAQICLPGTHDSGTYDLGNNAFPIEAPNDTVKALWNVGNDDLRDGMKNFARTQSLSIGQSLSTGIRYFDFRVNISGDEVYYLSHYIQGAPLSTVLSDIQTYLAANPFEFVIVKSAWKGDSGGKAAYLQAVKAAMGGLYADLSSSMNTPLATLQSAGTRFLFADQTQGINTSSYKESETATQILGDLTANYASAPFSGQLWEAQFVSLPTTKNYVIGVAASLSAGTLALLGGTVLATYLIGFLPGVLVGAWAVAVVAFEAWVKVEEPPESLEDWANLLIYGGLYTDYKALLKTGTKFPNLLLADFVEATPLVETAIILSLGGTGELQTDR